MAVNKPVKKGTAQTEKKAKGLLSGVGDYKGKTLNLKKSQLGKAGQAAASTRKIAISKTTYDPKTKKVTGPMGKPITGRVDLGGGNIAVYKNGVRVRAQKPSRPKGGPNGGPSSETNKPVSNYKTASRLGKPGEYQAGRGTTAKPKPRQKPLVTRYPLSNFSGGGSSRTDSGGGDFGSSSMGAPRGAAGGASGGRAGGSGPTGTPIQQKIRVIQNKITDARARAKASAAQANKSAAAAAQARRDAATLKALEAQLRNLK